MSRVYRALEKAEEEKKQRIAGKPSRQAFEERVVFQKETPPIKLSREKIVEFKLPEKEKPAIRMIPSLSFAGEEIRKMKTQLFQRLPHPPHSILVTSAVPQEGKTMIAVNLAVAISQEINRKAILIDGDLRRPSIQFEDAKNPKGLVDYLSNRLTLPDILTKSSIENLQLITAGAPCNQSAELIGSKRMGELMRSLREQSEEAYIIIDSSPLISTSDSVLLSKMADGIVLVVMADSTPRETIRRAIKLIDRQKIIGIVFNQVDLRQSDYYSRYHYYRYYSMDSEDQDNGMNGAQAIFKKFRKWLKTNL